jgi:formyl-CoA transferase
MVLPLSGVRVLDLSMVIAGPYACEILNELGAEVVKIEPLGGDPLRRWISPKGPMIFSLMNAGKKSVALNLRSPDAVETIKKMLPQFDVLLQNARGGQMEQLKLSAAECMSVNPNLVYVAVTGFGSTGPLARKPAYDSVAQGFAGLLALLTQGLSQPTVGPAIADIVTGLVAAQGVLAGLASRHANNGRGLVVETSLVESVVALIADTFVDQQTAGEQPNWVARQARSQIFILAGSDEKKLVIHLSTSERFFENLCRVLGRSELCANPRFETYHLRWANYSDLRSELQETFRTRTRDEWERDLSAGDVPNSPMLLLDEVRMHPQIQSLDLFQGDPETEVDFATLPWRFDGERPPRPTRAPELGEDTIEVLSEFLDGDEIRRLIASGAVFALDRR